MSTLVTLRDFKAYLGDTSDDIDEIAQSVLDHVEEALADQTGQTFANTASVTDEPHDGNDRDFLYLKRPPTALTADIKVGQDSSDPVMTIPTTDIIVDQDNSRIIYKNGLRFPRGRRNIFVSYTAADNLPSIALLAVKEAGAFLYRRIGKEHVASESFLDLGQINMQSVRFDFLPAWRQAVSSLRRYA